MELVEMHEPGDKVWTISEDGRLRAFVVQHDGSLALAKAT